MRKLIRNRQDIITNIRRYNSDITRSGPLRERAKYHRNWYVYDDNGRLLFGPGKFIGYLGISTKTYLAPKPAKDGRVTDKILSPYTSKVQAGSERFQYLYGELTKFLADYDIVPNKLASFRLLDTQINKPDVKPQNNDNLVDLLIGVISQLPAAQKKQIKSAIQI